MDEGWILDVHPDRDSESMVVWLKCDDGTVSGYRVRWSPTLHVSGEGDRLRLLGSRLQRMEYQQSLGGLKVRMAMGRLSHEATGPVEVLEVGVLRASNMARVADVILALGEWRDFEVFSVDPKPSQRFLFDHGTHPFGRIRVTSGGIEPLDSRTEAGWSPPPISRVMLSVDCRDTHGKRTSRGRVRSVTLRDLGDGSPSTTREDIRIRMVPDRDPESFIDELERAVHWLDPDIVVTKKGDSIDFPALSSIASRMGRHIRLGRNMREVALRRKAVTTWSYGRLLRSDAYHALEGRLHIDMGDSFIGKEGGVEGLCELSRMSGIPPQDLSRLSPGSAISAIQIRQSMEDGVLVPWKKNRPEDMKTANQMILSDRGGLYLDPRSGVHKNVYELDFASLFPSIIATRNISPETMNCDCCIPSGASRSGRLPLDPAKSSREICRRASSGSELELPVPEIGGHTCTKRHGFLGRVVAPIIERRRHLKSRITTKGDAWDKRQNVLKWLLVTCFGYTGYRNARFGRIECHEAICSWSREILLDAKQMAEDSGWDCLHAIVDSIWITDNRGRSESQRDDSISELISRIGASSGVPIELEDVYDWIAFVPNRTTGVGALTKYFAHGRKGWKIRGIELRQHSTCKWISEVQWGILEELRTSSPDQSLDRAVDAYRDQVRRLRNGGVPLSKLVISRRVRHRVGEHKVMNLTSASLLREKSLGQLTPPGRKIHFAVVGRDRPNPQDRVRMRSEIASCSQSVKGQKADLEYYEALALRAASALISPFGVSEAELESWGSSQATLGMWPAAAKSSRVGCETEESGAEVIPTDANLEVIRPSE